MEFPFPTVKTIVSKVRATPEWADSGKSCCHGMHRKNPYRRVKGRYWGIGLGSVVNCRHQLLVSRRRDMAGLHIPVPGASSRVILSPENTAQFYGAHGGQKAGRTDFLVSGIPKRDRYDLLHYFVLLDARPDTTAFIVMSGVPSGE